MNIDLIVGARPNFAKIAAIIRAISANGIAMAAMKYRLIHTGQHYDHNMSSVFLQQLGVPEPDINLGVGSGSQAEQTAKIMIGYEKVLKEKACDLCLVVGDVNSTLACSIVAKKQNILVAHVEAGIRSGDMTMPEEINRIVTDSITDYFFTTSEFANQNLLKYGVELNKINFVGNTMIDTLLHMKEKFTPPNFYEQLALKIGGYFVVTLHRPSNVDDLCKLDAILGAINSSCNPMPVIMPVHPRTMQLVTQASLKYENIHYTEPLGYLEFNFLVMNSKAVITDSGGITEETTVLGIPCMTLRDSTERPETIETGTNELLGSDPANIKQAIDRVNNGSWKRGGIPRYWDGKTGQRIVECLLQINEEFLSRKVITSPKVANG